MYKVCDYNNIREELSCIGVKLLYIIEAMLALIKIE